MEKALSFRSSALGRRHFGLPKTSELPWRLCVQSFLDRRCLRNLHNQNLCQAVNANGDWLRTFTTVDYFFLVRVSLKTTGDEKISNVAQCCRHEIQENSLLSSEMRISCDCVPSFVATQFIDIVAHLTFLKRPHVGIVMSKRHQLWHTKRCSHQVWEILWTTTCLHRIWPITSAWGAQG